MSDQTTTPNDPAPPEHGALIPSDYDQRAVFKQFLAVAEQAVPALREAAAYKGMTDAQIANGIVFDFVANVLSSVVYHNDVEVIDAIMNKAERQARAMMQLDAALLAAAPAAGEA